MIDGIPISINKQPNMQLEIFKQLSRQAHFSRHHEHQVFCLPLITRSQYLRRKFEYTILILLITIREGLCYLSATLKAKS
jgi:hypothetical protein